MCALNCSGGCWECAPDEHAAGSALDWLEEHGFELKDEDGLYRIATAIAKEIKHDPT